ncbi:MAG TPA: alpha/beta hydrolase [Candidatus Agrococcus pullicola]|uniref:Alpha/beta hydrolase n=1 Tax=Candidatus Agrococcus pullicola TaxID=2838429 RepID=A0A9D2C9X6_9MICO|nr:alpha/beta hydrolase [Candidatus Agrococcus pullicola]
MKHIILAPGLWLDGTAWSNVETPLRDAGHAVASVTLPGQGLGANTATLQDQLDAVLAAIDSLDAPAVLVGHSAASTLVWLAADRRPERVERVLMVGGFPATGGDEYAAFFDIAEGLMPFPGWEPFAGPDSDDMDDRLKQTVAAGAHPVPEGVAKGKVEYLDERRRDIPVVLVCPEYSPEDAQAWLAEGSMPELVSVRSVSFANIESGHWPMFTRPAQLAELIGAAAA